MLGEDIAATREDLQMYGFGISAARLGYPRFASFALAVGLALVATTLVQLAPAYAAPGTTNGKLALTAISSDTGGDIWVMDNDGTNAVNLTSTWVNDGFSSWESDPAWSPDGSQIVLRSTRGIAGTGLRDGIWIMDADGSNEREIYRASFVFQPAWSPDGEWIIFTQESEDVAESGWLYKIRPDGSDQTLILQAEADEDYFTGARWAPDGSVISFVAVDQFSVSTGIFTVKPDGTGRVPVVQSVVQSLEGHERPRWSPDATTIAYSAQAIASPRDILTVGGDGSNDTILVALAENPVWSPDGKTLLFSRRDGFTWRLYSMSAAGGPATEIPIPFIDSVSVFDPDWDWQPVPPSLADPVSGLVDPARGEWHLYDDAGRQTTSFFFGNPGDVPIVGDWDCDGVETPGMYRQSDGFVYLRNSNTQGIADIKFFFGNPGDVPIAGDFNDDGCGTVSIYRPSNQTFYIINKLGENNGGLGAADFSYVFGNPGDKPFVGDFDGDGVETVGLHRESTGLVYFRNSHSQGNADNQFIFGDPGDRLVAGDWNDNSIYSPALFRPSDTTMYFRHTNTQGNADNQFVPNPNGSTWLPVAGEFK